MKLFFQHIETLLARNDYVIVPHFGGFVAQQQSAEIHENTITPPFVAVGFNPLLRHSDGLLEMEIARAQGFAYRDAIENIAANVHKVNNLLAQNQIIDVGKLGEISQSSDKIIFRPAADFSFLPANLGLQNADFHFINAKNNFENKNKKGDKAITVILYPKMMLRYAASIALIFSMLFAQPFLDDKQQQASFLPILKSEKPQFETFKYVPYLADTMKMVQDAESFSNESEKNTVFAKAETNNLNP
ncbi:MAG: hypothetical protein LBB41_03045, partial [Prevotellaceae bacterium]|nr:hypothetical protein [Prevotellaceae bacterium]